MRDAYAKFRRDLAAMPPARRRLVIGTLTTAALLLLASLGGALYLWKLARQFPQAPFKQPSRLYGSATQLTPGTPLGAADLIAELESQGYREASTALEAQVEEPLAPGSFRREDDRLRVHLRRTPTPEGMAAGDFLEVAFRGRRVAKVLQGGRAVERASLPPPLLASFYGPEVQERRPVTIDELPEEVVRAILAAEDDGFFTHPGVSPTGIARALWVNLRGGELQQGGSTITQQLVKNVYLSRERTLARKAKEALIAMMLELRHGKPAILEAYLNEIYWGASGSANLIGLGAAAYAYFGKEARELTLEEAATLAGMIQAPATYSPIEHPEKAIERRNWVLKHMAELGWISRERARQSWTEALRVAPHKPAARKIAPYFAEFAKAEAEERFGIDDLGGEGYLLFSSLGWHEQRQAEQAVQRALAGLDPRWEKNREREPLQGALISIDPRNGAVLAYVGGRDYQSSQFDRVTLARRQAGSTFKPVVYAVALSEGVATPVTLLKDSPIIVRIGNQTWRPQNYDRGFQGSVTVRTALERSLNIPTVRLAMQVGLRRIVEQAREMGLAGELEPVPALALGAFEVTPRELAEVYSSFANDGLRPTLHGLVKVVDRHGEEILGEDLPAPRRVLTPQAAFLVTSMLEGVIDRGTAAAARGQGVHGHLAGKTGTTNDRRDNWFVGYSPDRVTVVWVGYDDNRRTKLSGSSAALPIWSRFVAAVRPPGGYPDFVPPQGIMEATVDPTTGQIATEYCPYAVTDLFPEWQVPAEPCRRHQPGFGQVWADYNDPMFDPLTGEPLDPYRIDPYLVETESGLTITNMPPEDPEVALGYDTGEPWTEDPADLEPVEIQPQRRPVPPVRINPLRPMPPSTSAPVDISEIDTEAEEGEEATILIRPTRERPAEPETEAAEPETFEEEAAETPVDVEAEGEEPPLPEETTDVAPPPVSETPPAESSPPPEIGGRGWRRPG